MEISDVLENKLSEIMVTGNPLATTFTVDEINILSDIMQLRTLKVSIPFPKEFDRTRDIFSCTKKILEGDSTYRVLEFCMLKNRVLLPCIIKVFPRLNGEY